MRIALLLFAFISFPFFLAGQSFARPDSMAVVRNHVKSATISRDNKAVVEFKFDTRGCCTYEWKTKDDFYFTYESDSTGRRKKCLVYDRRTNEQTEWGELEYYPRNQLRRDIDHLPEHDVIYTFDTLGRWIGLEVYTKDTLQNISQCEYDAKGKCIYVYDSIIEYDSAFHRYNLLVHEWKNGRLTRKSAYDTQNGWLNTWLVSYDSSGRTSTVVFRTWEKKTKTFSFVYQADTLSGMLQNGKKMKKEEEQPWEVAFNSIWLDDPPFTDLPHYEMPVYLHHPDYDANGNVIRDTVSAGGNLHLSEIIYTYMYLFYPPGK